MTDHDDHDEEQPADAGVKQVGAEKAPTRASRRSEQHAAASSSSGRRNPLVLRLAFVAVLGLAGTITFGLLWAAAPSNNGTYQDPSAISAANKFLVDFFNFNAKTVDTDFNAVTAMATGNFSTQVNQFFNSAIRTELEKALAESRGQIRVEYVQKENAAQTSAELYAVIDQLYVNNKITTPQSDVVRLVVDLTKLNGNWKISNVSVLEGASPASVGTPSGSAGSSVPGQ